ncbi:DsrE family protein [Noviherbaspirillum sedimenti]|uniref:Uncharacterized protein n=1 Tax=Noviherbaspirillum sedimenti TaxID=2320865 RepID=A0A3A3G8I1_9BURK|nr:DsrE family protein [Noviherbaspirillum sedimenti]RJG03059.1 hypothetical protein D3878_16970 [Noviherbaspirillum sedimenti]
MRREFTKRIAAGMLALAGGLGALAAVPAQAAEQVKVVYHLLEGNNQAVRALGNIRNHLRAAPEDRIVVVAHGEGIRFLIQGARDRDGKPFDEAVAALARQGVEFRVCRNTLTAHDIPVDQLLPQASLVPSGVAEIARLQAKEGFVYLRP